MPAWTAFGAVVGLVLCVVLLLARSTASATDTGDDRATPASTHDDRAAGTRSNHGSIPDSAQPEHASAPDVPVPSDVPGEDPAAVPGRSGRESPSLASLSTTALFANVLVTHGLFGAIILGAAVVTGVPWRAFGIEATAASVGPRVIALGAGLGVALYLADEALAALLDSAGVDTSESLRQALEPDSTGGWVLLLLIVLPTVAGFEELLFRAVLVGALPTGFPLPAAGMVVLSTIVFALGHGLQGPGGILVTGLLGGVLGVAFLLSGSFLLVFVAHYVVNALELVVHEGLDVGLPT